jgi:hypothetical protein
LAFLVGASICRGLVTDGGHTIYGERPPASCRANSSQVEDERVMLLLSARG